MIISIVNRSKKITDEQLQNAIRAINRQIAQDFQPYWSFGANLRLEGAVGKAPNKQTLAELRGDAILYLWDKADTDGALGYHDTNFRGIPYGFVFTELCEQLGESWTVTLSHEALELLADAQVNLLVQGPHPEEPNREVFHWFEMCDAVQSQTYKIDDVEVSNFVLPLYFTPEEQAGGRNDFLGRLQDGKGLTSFGVAKGGYIGFYDPQTGNHENFALEGDKKAQKRMAIKGKAMVGRGYARKHSQALGAREDAHRGALSPGVKRGARAMSADPIKHVVVLMLENRSFDQMLGDATRIYPALDGIPQNGARFTNKSSKSGKIFAQTPNAAEVTNPDPDHELVDVLKQFGTAANPMSGFIDSYLSVAGVNEVNAQQVMDYYPFGDTPAGDSLPALHALARNFLVCDRWFSSMPGPTWPNRFFVHSGTCLGHVLMPSRKHPMNMRLYNQDTIYERLDDADKNWRIYHDGIPQSIVMTELLPKIITSRYRSMKRFFEDVKGPPDKFPEYVFIEPRYFSPNENDQHPPSDVGSGDRLIASVYNALRNSALWESTLLIVTYDEHGGFYDHVTPPATVAPDGHTKEYSFNQFGARVPAIMVSPWVDAGVCKTEFDHTSILRYLSDKFGLSPLGNRAAQAQSFAPELTKRGTPRNDTPQTINGRAAPRAARAARARPVASPVMGSREALLYYVASLSTEAQPKGAAKRSAKVGARPFLAKLSDAELRAKADAQFEAILGAEQSIAKKPAREAAASKVKKRK